MTGILKSPLKMVRRIVSERRHRSSTLGMRPRTSCLVREVQRPPDFRLRACTFKETPFGIVLLPPLQEHASLSLRTVAIGSAVIVAAGVTLYIVIRLAVFGEINPHRLDRASVQRIRISAEAIVSGQLVSGEWTVPAMKHWGPPGGWTWGGTGSFRTLRFPFDTVFMRLPTGEGMGIRLEQSHLDMTGGWQPVVPAVEQNRTPYYLLDSIDRPTVLTDYTQAARSSRNCPKDDFILDCKVSSSMTFPNVGPLELPARIGGDQLLPQGSERYEELRQFGLEPPKPLIFVYSRADFSPSALFSDPYFESLLRSITKPTIIWIDKSDWYRLPDRRNRYVDLSYEGSRTWRFDDIDGEISSPSERPTVYRLADELMPDDLLWAAGTWVKDDKITSVFGTIRYRGELLSFGTGSSGQIPLLIDPDNRTVARFLGPMSKVLWMMPSR